VLEEKQEELEKEITRNILIFETKLVKKVFENRSGL
jgi:hypothetical protein